LAITSIENMALISPRVEVKPAKKLTIRLLFFMGLMIDFTGAFFEFNS
jgi:hypothetical protein